MLAISSFRPPFVIDLTGPQEICLIIDSDDEQQPPPSVAPQSRMEKAAAAAREVAVNLIVDSEVERPLSPPPSVAPPSQMENAVEAVREVAEFLCGLTSESPKAQSAGSKQKDSPKPTTVVKRRRVIPLETADQEKEHPVIKVRRTSAMLTPVSYTQAPPPARRKASKDAQKKLARQLKLSDDYLSQLRHEARDKDYQADQVSDESSESSSSYSVECPKS
ncbi:MAG: hypothetical protein LLG04_08045 [Parachlamydia sp.]|nr:hypothetical protein [Parachlamydia sp.]